MSLVLLLIFQIQIKVEIYLLCCLYSLMNIVLLLISILTFVLGISCLLLEIYIFKKAPFLEVNCSNKPINTSLTVIIPAYNEEINIIKCLNSLNKISKPSIQFKILVVDDSSDDKTLVQVENFKNERRTVASISKRWIPFR